MSAEVDLILHQLHGLAAIQKGGELVRRHLYAPDVHLYVRLGPRFCGPDSPLACLVVVDVSIADARQRQGLFSELLRALEAELPVLGLQALVVENVGNPHLLAYLKRIGYRTTGLCDQTVFKEKPMGNPTRRPDIEAALKDPDNHFMDWRQLDDGTYIALGRLMTTVGLFVGVGPITPYKRRYCFRDLHDAAAAFIDMETGDDVPTGWVARRPETPEDIEAKSKPGYDVSQFWPKKDNDHD